METVNLLFGHSDIIMEQNMRSVTRGYGYFEQYLAELRAAKADSLIPNQLRGGRILDIGCGTQPLFLLSTKFNEKYGIDPSLEQVQFGDNIKISKTDLAEGSRLPFDHEYFDVVTMLAVIEHFTKENAQNVLNEIFKILKPGGILIITTPCPWSDIILKIMAKLKLTSEDEINDHKSMHDRSSLVRDLESAGFKKKKITFGYFELFLNSWMFAVK